MAHSYKNMTMTSPGVWSWAGAEGADAAIRAHAASLQGGKPEEKVALAEITPYILLGSADAATSAAGADVASVLAVGTAAPAPGIASGVRLAVDGGAEDVQLIHAFPLLVDFLAAAAARHERVLVYDGAGGGASFAVVAAYAMASGALPDAPAGDYPAALAALRLLKLPDGAAAAAADMDKNLERQLTTWAKLKEFPDVPGWMAQPGTALEAVEMLSAAAAAPEADEAEYAPAAAGPAGPEGDVAPAAAEEAAPEAAAEAATEAAPVAEAEAPAAATAAEAEAEAAGPSTAAAAGEKAANVAKANEEAMAYLQNRAEAAQFLQGAAISAGAEAAASATEDEATAAPEAAPAEAAPAEEASAATAEADGAAASPAPAKEKPKEVSPVAAAARSKTRKSLLAGLRSGALHKAVDKMEADEAAAEAKAEAAAAAGEAAAPAEEDGGEEDADVLPGAVPPSTAEE